MRIKVPAIQARLKAVQDKGRYNSGALGAVLDNARVV